MVVIEWNGMFFAYRTWDAVEALSLSFGDGHVWMAQEGSRQKLQGYHTAKQSHVTSKSVTQHFLSTHCFERVAFHSKIYICKLKKKS